MDIDSRTLLFSIDPEILTRDTRGFLPLFDNVMLAARFQSLVVSMLKRRLTILLFYMNHKIIKYISSII